MSELQTVSLVLLKISINDLSSGVRNRIDTVKSEICSLRPSQKWELSVWCTSPEHQVLFHKNLLAHSPDFLIFSSLQQANFICRLRAELCLCL